LAPYITSCPADNPRVEWSNYPALNVTNAPSLIRNDSKAAVSTNVSAIFNPSDAIHLTWELPGLAVGPNKSYTTVKPAKSPAKYAILLAGYNATYTELFDVTETSATTYFPSTNPPPLSHVAGSITAINGTNFLAVVSDNPHLTPYNFTAINDYIVAGPVVVQYG